ncbi:DUF748 domain-containing protein [Yinghuangia sp. ASG 101]|uniref:DUF748 domain-containing protein n=1 Tax=Yinghuangia sp. ASG 101 TaxID=2896848 RepID=UPI001E580350|nr:DUF748 domain-containing protein [Yinghuangia sp. ASG 101]UGQ09692.1 DUF748 domain-containing protein [Yinghuangia sp. ASG 101]
MNTVTRVGAYGACVALAFGAAFGVGNAFEPLRDGESSSGHGHGEAADSPGPAPSADAAAVGGLQVSERGYTLVPQSAPPVAGTTGDFRFRILGPDGTPWTRYEQAHEKDLHLIVARRDLSGFQHVHPVLGADGTWSVPLAFPTAGDYRVFADFVPAGDPGGGLTLGADVAVPGGDYRTTPLPAPARTAAVDGYTVTLDGDLTTSESTLTLSVARDGIPVTDLQPYLGAYGHLVVLRQGDLAYLHVHPQGEPGDGTTPAGPGIGFHAQAPSAGTYRLYLDFRHEGVVRTAEFTVTVGAGALPAAPTSPASIPATPLPGGSPASEGEPGHGGHAH